MDPDLIEMGRGQIQMGGQTIFAQDRITIKWLRTQFKINSSNHGAISTRTSARMIEITLTPVGRVTAALLAVLYPHFSKKYGALAIGGTDVPCEVYFDIGDGVKYTIHRAVVMDGGPQIRGTVGATPFQQLKIHGLLVADGAPSDDDAYFTRAAATYPGDAALNKTQILTRKYHGAWGTGDTFESFDFREGFTFSPGVSLTAYGVDGLGVIDYMVAQQAPTVTCQPAGISEADLAAKLAYQGTGRALGTEDSPGTDDLNLIADEGGLYIRLYNAALRNESIRANAMEDSVGQLEFYTDRELSSGVEQPLAYIGTSAPS